MTFRVILKIILLVAEVNNSHSTIGVDLYPRGLHVSSPVSLVNEFREVKKNLVPSGIKTNRHGGAKVLNGQVFLKITQSKSSMDVLVIENLGNARSTSVFSPN